MRPDAHVHLAGLTRDALAALCAELGQPPYRAAQILDGLYRSPAQSLDEIRTLPAAFRRQLSEDAILLGSRVVEVASSADGTDKLLLELSDGERIECVAIPEPSRLTCCLSSQAGCAMHCLFCASGAAGLARNLTAAEIVEQAVVLYKRERDARWRSPHIVLMGLGEPLANYDNVMAAIRVLNADWGLGIGARRFTVSTIGLPRGIARLAREKLQVNLAISLHAPNDRIRNQIVPANRRVGVEKLLAAAGEFFLRTGRQVTFEYVLIDGLNADLSCASELARLLRDRECVVNLIPLNPFEGLALRPPPRQHVQAFAAALRRGGLKVTLRKRRGSDIDGACGQLRLRRRARPR